jgi:membrane protease YdiL (CAAX protease family)
MPAKPIRVGAWEALLPFVCVFLQTAIVVAVVVGLISWPLGLGLWIVMLVPVVVFVAIRASRQRASLQPGEWIELKYPRRFPGDRAFGLFFVGLMLALVVLFVIATITKAVGE